MASAAEIGRSPSPALPALATPEVATARSQLQLLPPTLLNFSMNFLTPRDICTTEEVCRAWRSVITNDDNQTVWKTQCIREGIIPTLARIEKAWRADSGAINYKREVCNPNPFRAFGADAWAYHYGNPGGKFPISQEMLAVLREPDPWERDKTVAQTFDGLFMPQTIDGVEMCHNSLAECIKQPKKGFPTWYSMYSDGYLQEGGKTVIQKPYWSLIRRGTLPGSIIDDQGRTLNPRDTRALQDRLIEQASGYQIARTLEIASHVFTTFVRSGKTPITYVIRSAEYFEGFPWIVKTTDIDSGFNGGLRIVNDSYNMPYGVTVVRRFPIDGEEAKKT